MASDELNVLIRVRDSVLREQKRIETLTHAKDARFIDRYNQGKIDLSKWFLVVIDYEIKVLKNELELKKGE